MKSKLSRNNKQKVTVAKINSRFVNKMLKAGQRKKIENFFFKIQNEFFAYNKFNTLKWFLWNQTNLFLNPVDIKTWEPTRKRQGKIATTIRKKLKEKSKKFNTLLTFPVHQKKQYTNVISLLAKKIVLKKLNNKVGIRKNLQKRLFSVLMNIVTVKKSTLYKIKVRQQTIATNIKITSVSKRKRWY